MSDRALPSREHLRDVIEHVPGCRARAADILYQLPDKDAKDLQCLVKFAPLYAEEAARMLLDLSSLAPSDLDVVFERITSRELRLLAGRIILDMDRNQGRQRYAKVVNEVPELRDEALAALLEAGPDDPHDLECLWLYADPVVLPAQWSRFVNSDNDFYYRTIMQSTKFPVLRDAAFEEFKKLPVRDWWDVTFLFYIAELREKAWQWLKAIDKLDRSLIWKTLDQYPAMENLAWDELRQNNAKSHHDWFMTLMGMASDRDGTSRRLRMRALNEALQIAQTAQDLDLLLLYNETREQAGQRLVTEFTFA